MTIVKVKLLVRTEDTRDLYRPTQNFLGVSDISCDVRTFARGNYEHTILCEPERAQ